MYNERNEEFSIRDIILQLLFVVLFVFILLWLFPTKSDINKLANNNNNNVGSLEPIYARIFNDNILNMKDAGKEYFTTERVPQKIGDKVTLTLGDMLNKKLLLPFVDSKGRQCDLSKSYIEVTKTSELEYTMKVNLDCTDASDYILIPMGCYDFCKTDICEKETTRPVVTKPTPKPDPVKPIPNKPKPDPVKPTPNKPKPDPVKPDPVKPDPVKPDPVKPDPVKPDPVKPIEYVYEYTKTTPAYFTNWSSWSNWSTNYVRETDLVDVRTEEITNTVKKQIGIKKVTQSVPYTTTKKAHVDNLVTKTCAKWGTVTVSTGSYKYGTEWNYVKTISATTPPSDTATTRYVRVKNSSGDTLDCNTNCNSIYSNYKVYTRETYEIKQSGYTCTEYGLTVTPIYIDKQVTEYKTEIKYEPVYGNVKETVTYYQSRTRKVVPASTNTIWSKYNDTYLINNGYKYTGKVRVK